MDKSLEIVQRLYENGYLTYPRTNSEYLAVNEKGKIKTIIENISKIGYPVKFKDKKTIFDDSKIESHSALTPTYKIPNKNNLTEEEFLIYQTVFKRFVAVFCSEECKVEKTEIKIKFYFIFAIAMQRHISMILIWLELVFLLMIIAIILQLNYHQKLSIFNLFQRGNLLVITENL